MNSLMDDGTEDIHTIFIGLMGNSDTMIDIASQYMAAHKLQDEWHPEPPPPPLSPSLVEMEKFSDPSTRKACQHRLSLVRHSPTLESKVICR
jgi:hypothetical protein